MNRLYALFGVTVLFVLLLLVGLGFTQGFLRRETDRVQRETIQARQSQFERTLQLAHLGPPPWSAEVVQQLAATLAAEIEVRPANAPVPPAEPTERKWAFRHLAADESGRPAYVVEVRFAAPAIARLAGVHRKVAAITLGTALLFVFGFGLVVWVGRHLLMETLPVEAGTSARSHDSHILHHLAERSTRQHVELEHERLERQRAEADSHLKQTLLNRSLQEKIDMGRDLHDGLIQSLYATGLTLQAARKTLATNPEGAREQIETGVTTINNAIREVRGYITGLAPEKLREQTFSQSVQALVQTLAAARDVRFDLRIDDPATHRLNDTQLTDLLQIVREAVSNALRHGAASAIAVRLHEQDAALCLLVQDNGRGFNPATASGGHGLANIRARAQRLGATLACTSEPAGGTRLVLTFALPPTQPS